MDKSYPSPMPVVLSLDVEKDLLKPRDDVEGMLGLEVPYLSAIEPTNTIGWESRISFDISKAPHITWHILVISEKSELQYHQDTLMLATWMIPTMCINMVELSLH